MRGLWFQNLAFSPSVISRYMIPSIKRYIKLLRHTVRDVAYRYVISRHHLKHYQRCEAVIQAAVRVQTVENLKKTV